MVSAFVFAMTDQNLVRKDYMTNLNIQLSQILIRQIM